ncbi:allophanate hydrolase [Caulobacter vibrioides]|uniref:allophanate hydrolase n=1 Tax=Caulobacter vibrioides TaxID=155892 RepID=UPI000BB50D88|nr:allophanate hydrolase [Caulobacter vibrioides]ATC24798.1 allophanate hydrolase [Caulobacter vibrioides]AZH12960.1 allophanate hydrolase [Caulobacter vibrioides]PLR09573.1 allophanate hydrolase [Caulobacter vibrioides]
MNAPRFLVGEIAAGVNAGGSAESVARSALAAIEAYDAIQPQVWTLRLPEAAVLAQARAVDARIAAGETLPLAGVPFAVKDNIDVADLATTAACPAFAYTAGRSATVVEQLLAAGAVLVGKTNLDQFATGLVGTRSPYGAPRCVFNQAFVSGGSSSGSAVAVAAGLVAFALGTDTAGSGRVPAAFNHLVGLKPSKGRWSTRGLVPACRSLDCISVFAADLDGAGRVDAVLAAFDPEDPYSRPAPQPEPALTLAGLRVAIPRPEQRIFFGDGESEALYASAVSRLQAAGAVAVEVDIAPLLDAAKLLYSGPWVAERTAAVEPLLRAAPSAIEPTVRAIVQGGLAVTGVETFRGLYALEAYRRAAEAVWAAADALFLPTTPTIYTVKALKAEPLALNANLGLYTNFVNLLDLSALAVPAGFRADGTGFGVTFIGPAFADRALLDLAAVYLETFPMAETPPLDLTPHKPGVKLAVVGAHLSGMPLHWQLTSREARLVAATRTAPAYKLYAMAESTPPKPALVHVGDGGASILVEVYELDVAAFGAFTAEVPAPLAIGTVTLEDGTSVKGFVAEPRALNGASDITVLGGWPAYIASLQG